MCLESDILKCFCSLSQPSLGRRGRATRRLCWCRYKLEVMSCHEVVIDSSILSNLGSIE